MKEKNYSSAIEESLRETRAVFVFECFVELVLGIVIIIFPDLFPKVLSIIIGAALAGVGVFNIISYLMSREVPFRQGLFTGVIMTAVGISFIAQSDKLANVLGIIFGVFMVFEGLSCCRRSFIMRQLDFRKWWIPFIISMLACVAGVFMLIYPEATSEIIQIIAGITLIIEAGLGLWTIFGLMYHRKKLQDALKINTFSTAGGSGTAVIDVKPEGNNASKRNFR